MTSVAVGMSGGVDSSVAAHLLKERGYDVTGVFMDCWDVSGCQTNEDRRDALKVALKLGIPFQVLDYKKEYREKVVQYFYDTYKNGLTPNPDVMCNQEIKFGLFYKWALRLTPFAQGKPRFDYIATGHYASIKNDESGYKLRRPLDVSKDQTYFLYRLKKKQLENVLFPLGNILKKQVREKAKSLKLNVFDKPDSMGVCFMGDVNVNKLIKKRLGEKPGKVVLEGKEVGDHRGLWFHTVGQRGGFEINKKRLKQLGYKPESMEPLYVIDKDVEGNRLVVGKRKEAEMDSFAVGDVHLLADESCLSGDLYVRIRNLGELVKCKIERDGNKYVIMADKKMFGVAKGQSAVFYLRDGVVGEEMVVGGGVIL